MDITVVVAGHIDHGKSTLIGRLLLDTKSLPKEKLAEISRISRELGRGMELAWLTDQLEEEREREKTIDTAQVFLRHGRRRFCLVDAPGHVELLKNMVSGATMADAAILVVDAAQGVEEQTRRHALLLGLLGIGQAVVAVNKMDLVAWRRERFDAVRIEAEAVLRGSGVEAVSAVPISASEGANAVKPDRRLRWYDGPPLMQALGRLRRRPPVERGAFRFPVQDVYERARERVAVGRVASGGVRPGDRVLILPRGEATVVQAIRVFGIAKPGQAAAGQSVGLVLGTNVSRGEVLAAFEGAPRASTRFQARVFWMSRSQMVSGGRYTIRCATQEFDATGVAILSRLDPAARDLAAGEPAALGQNEIGAVVFEAERPVVMEPADAVPDLGRFVIEQDGEVAGAGTVVSTE